jgi:predicted Zn-dependent protease
MSIRNFPARRISRRSLVAGLGGAGLAVLSAPALAQFSLKFGGSDDSGGGFKLDLGKLFSSAQNLFESFDLSEEDELKIGEQLYPKLIDRSGGRYANRRIQADMDRFAEPLFRTSARTNLSWEISVINDNRVNAWALPGGKLGINKGLLRYVNDESELAAVLAHEIGHVHLSHGLKHLKSKKFTTGLTEAASAALSSEIDSMADQIVTDKLIEKLEGPIHKMATSGYARDSEREADAHILTVFEQTGHDPAKAANLFKVLLEITPEDSEETTSLFSSHPDTRERIDAIELKAADMSSPSSPPPAEGFADMKRSFPTRKKFRRRA